MQNQEIKSKVKDVIQLDSELLDNLSSLIENKAEKEIVNLFIDLHPADIAEIINHLKVDDAAYCFELLHTELAGEVIVELDENLREKILKQTDTEKIANIIDELETDDATDILSELSDEVAEEILENIDPEDSSEVKQLMKYDEESAGGLMSSDFVYVLEKATVGNAISEVRKNADEFEHIYQIYVLNEDDMLLGFVQLKSLLINDFNTSIVSIMEEDLLYVTPEVDQEEVANIMEKYDLVALPVVDSNKIMLGRITIDDIVDVIQEEAEEDIQKIAGLSEEQETSDSIIRISRIRLPWLLIGMLMEMISALVLSGYSDVLSQLVIATFFIPIVMAMGGSSGTQAAIVMVRGLSSGEVWMANSLRHLAKEFFVALLNGFICSIFLFVATYIFNTISSSPAPFEFILVLSGSLFAIITFATMIGASVPLVLKKLGADPATATGPFVTSSNDIIGLLIYLTILYIFIY